MAGVHTRRHQIVARAFRRALGEHRRFDVDEALRVEILAHFHRDAITQTQVLLHLRTAQVEHAMREARGFREVVVVELERRRHRRVQHVSSWHSTSILPLVRPGVRRAFRTAAHDALHLHAELVAHALGDLEHVGAVRIADDLDEPFAIAQVDEDNAAVVAAAVYPAAQRDGLAQQGFGHQTAVFRSHRHDVVSFVVSLINGARANGFRGACRHYSGGSVGRRAGAPARGGADSAPPRPSRRCTSARHRRTCRAR